MSEDWHEQQSRSGRVFLFTPNVLEGEDIADILHALGPFQCLAMREFERLQIALKRQTFAPALVILSMTDAPQAVIELARSLVAQSIPVLCIDGEAGLAASLGVMQVQRPFSQDGLEAALQGWRHPP